MSNDKVPDILTDEEVRRILHRAAPGHYRVALATIYSCGLRLGEGLKLEVRDVDTQRRLRP